MSHVKKIAVSSLTAVALAATAVTAPTATAVSYTHLRAHETM